MECVVMHDSASKPVKWSFAAAFALFCPLMAGGCAHVGGGDPQFAELGSASPEPAAAPTPSRNPLFRLAHMVTPGHGVEAGRLSLNSSIASICSNPGGRAVIDEDLPGLTTRPEYDFFKHMSLKALKSMSGGKMSDEDLAKVASDLAKLDDEPSLHAMR